TNEAISSGFKAADIRSPLYVSMEIRQFGYNLFDQSPTSFAPVEAIPVGPDYVLGPGDEMSVAIWGKVTGEYRRIIDKDGKINLPTVGVLQIAGLTFQGAKGFIEKEYGRYYTDMKINISMGNLKSIRVFVVGNVQRPGSYTISSFSTIITALFAAGGPGKVGSMRNVQLKRNGQTVASLDLYDFLLKGDKTDVRLLSEDVIFIPPVGPLVGIAGNVKVPAIYELKGETRLSDLISMAGGTNSISFKNRVQIQRVEGGREQTLREMNLSEIEKGKGNDIVLKDGDVLKIFPISQTVEKVVHVTGAVKSPGTYGFRTGMTLKDLLTYTGGLLRYASNDEAELTRVSISSEGPKTERIIVKLKEALEGDAQYNIPLKEDDYLFVRTVPEWELYRTVTISGEVRYPGTYTIQKRETLSSLIE
ncbi:MAG: SLBB domain-containing protein, partial [Nitrospirota bacterium]|nr:SLBB domain-containing protein [Nitrospirota bacterium]